MGLHEKPGESVGHAQDRDALVLGGVGIGAHRQPHVVRHVGAAGEDLGPVHHVLVTVAHGPRLQRGQVGAGFGLGVADGEVDLAGEDGGEEEALLLFAAEAHDRRPHRVDGHEREGCAGATGLVEEDELVRGGATLAPEFLGPPDAEPTVLADAPHDLTPQLAALADLADAPAHLVGEQTRRSRRAVPGAGPAARGSPPGTWRRPTTGPGRIARSRPWLSIVAAAHGRGSSHDFRCCNSF